MNRPDDPMREIAALRERLSRLSEASLHITEDLDLDAVLQGVLDGARSLTGARMGGITILDDSGQLQDFITSGLTDEDHQRFVNLPGGPEFFAYLSGLPEPLRLADFSAHTTALGLPGIGPPLGPVGSFLGAPIRLRGVRAGNLYLSDKEGGGEFTQDDEETLAMFASHAAMAIANARRHREEQRARAYLETLIDTSPVGVVVFNAGTGVPVSLNREARRLVDGLTNPGQTAEQLLDVLTFRRADGREISLREFPLAEALSTGETVRAEEIVISVPDGRSVSVLLNATAIRSEEGQVESVHFIPVPECDVPEQFRQGSDDAETVIEDVAGIEQGIAADVRENLFKRLAQTETVAGEEENPYNHRMLYIEQEADASDLRSAWWDSKEEIRTRARFFGATTAATLERIFEDLASLRTIWGKPVVREIHPGDKDSSFWRARTAHSESEIQSILESLSSRLGPPPSDKATASRMNAEGIPVFYGALEEETCVSEVRAPVGSFVVLVKFDLLSPINVLDLEALSNPDSEVSHFDPDYIEKRSRERFLKELVGEMSRPVMPHEEAREYIATQIVSEYLANRVEPRLHGIIFSSAQTGKGGRNVVLFVGARSVEADEPAPGLRVRIPPRSGIPQPGTETSEDSIIQTEPQGATAATEQSGADPTTVDPETQVNHGDSILRLDPQSLKVLAVSAVKYETKALPLNRDHKVSGGTVRFHFAVPTPKVTVSRRNHDQDQETGQQLAEDTD